jgi:4a-hydroxytetrahydrobiopterin dehydratase
MQREKLESGEIARRLSELKGWSEDEGKLKRRYKFGNFTESLEFVNKVGALAEAADHHPDIRFGWGYADIEITTHDRGGVTDFDFALAKKIDEI